MPAIGEVISMQNLTTNEHVKNYYKDGAAYFRAILYLQLLILILIIIILTIILMSQTVV